MGRVLVFTALMLAVSSSVIYAQDGTKTPVTHNQTVSANPLGFMSNLRLVNVGIAF
jgi:hypothetical protein